MDSDSPWLWWLTKIHYFEIGFLFISYWNVRLQSDKDIGRCCIPRIPQNIGSKLEYTKRIPKITSSLVGIACLHSDSTERTSHLTYWFQSGFVWWLTRGIPPLIYNVDPCLVCSTRFNILVLAEWKSKAEQASKHTFVYWFI